MATMTKSVMSVDDRKIIVEGLATLVEVVRRKARAESDGDIVALHNARLQRIATLRDRVASGELEL